MKSLLISLLLLIGTYAQAKIGSVYTSVEPQDCVTINGSELLAEPEIDFYEGECAAFGGYRVYISGGDIRYSLDLSYQGQSIDTIKLASFHDMGSAKIEWRYERKGDGFDNTLEYTALIYRLNYTTYTENGEPTDKDMLVVVRLDQQNSCVIGTIEQQANMNEKARQLADNKSASCQ